MIFLLRVTNSIGEVCLQVKTESLPTAGLLGWAFGLTVMLQVSVADLLLLYAWDFIFVLDLFVTSSTMELP